MKLHLLDTFRYNDKANQELAKAIKALPEKEQAIKLFSHLITSQDKWYNRMTKKIPDTELSWFGTEFKMTELEREWKRSVDQWICFIENASEWTMDEHIIFDRSTDGKKVKVKIKDVILQLNYHSIHHRAQINSLMSKQGIKPPPTDYIYTAISEVEL
jgi:uncharacterized damage-inducible protein DinB